MKKKQKPQVKKPNKTPFGIIGGSGTFGFEDYKTDEYSIETPYGRIIIEMIHYNDLEIAFAARHGRTLKYPPHQTNYRGNIEALSSLGVEYLLATCSVTSVKQDLRPGELVMLEDFTDFTKSRFYTFHQDGEILGNVEMDDPYCYHLRKQLLTQAKEEALPLTKEVIYAAMEGPRKETRSEASFFHKMGWDVLGMTSVPEVILAKEKGMCYASVGLVTMLSKGLQEDLNPSSAELDEKRKKIVQLFLHTFENQELCHEHCSCRTALSLP